MARRAYREDMDAAGRLGEYLRARRELVRPADVGLPDFGRRRVPGLRREELAMLAGISADYYVRLEQGRDHHHPSGQVLDALACALQLDDHAAAHLHELARPAARRRRPRRPERAQAGAAQLVASWTQTPAFVQGRLIDVLAANPLATALSPICAPGVNIVRAVFLDPAVRERFRDWERRTENTVAALRALVGADLDDPALTALVGELSLKSERFRRLWARHDVRPRTSARPRSTIRRSACWSCAARSWRSPARTGRSSWRTTPSRGAPRRAGSCCWPASRATLRQRRRPPR
jgi:transcriptional regulator with XRE-family HTH domain